MTPLLEPYDYLEAGNMSPRSHGPDWDGVVLHFTAGGNGRKTAHWARSPIGRSWHFLVYRDGQAAQQVPLNMEAWHAGRSEWPHSSGETLSGANNYSVGIELANHGPLELKKGRFFYEINGQMFPYRGPQPVRAALVFDNGHSVEDWWEPFLEPQLAGLDLLLERLKQAGVPMRLFGHEEVGMPMGRKVDPGPAFPWERYGRPLGRRTQSIILGAAPVG